MHVDIEQLFSLKGRLALVTAGTSTLGFDAASILAAAGADIILTSRDILKAEKAAALIMEQYGVDAWPVTLDHTHIPSVRSLESELKRRGVIPDILVNNAGGGSGKSVSNLFERSFEDIAASIDVNLTGVIYCTKVIAALMAQKGSGKIINIASIAGLLGRDRRIYTDTGMLGQPVDYAASKAGVIGLTRDLAAFLAPYGILVNAISPGGFTSDLRGHPQNFVERYADKTPLGRMGSDRKDLKGAVLFLASPASDYITGQNIIVDGGFTIFK
jgi:NAD(P)-dependent dehydrogenase (short-subunit alcohol dehydrogenase family)